MGLYTSENNRWKVMPKLARYILLMSVLFLICIWGLFFYVVAHDKAVAVRDAYTETSNLAGLCQNQAEQVIAMADQLTALAKHLYENGEKDSLVSLQYLARRTAAYNIFLLDENGKYLVNSGDAGSIPFRDILDRHFYIYGELDAEAVFVGKAVWDDASNQWFIPISRRLEKPDGSFGGMVIVMEGVASFSALYNQLDDTSNQAVFLFGRDGIVRNAKNNEILRPGTFLPANGPVMNNLRMKDGGQFIMDRLYPDHYLTSYSSLLRYPLSVAVGVPESEVIAKSQRNLPGYLALALALSVGVIAFAVVSMQLIARQKRTEEELCQAHATLQQKVAERTEELQDANTRLHDMNGSLETINQQLEEEIAERRHTEELLHAASDDLRYIAYYDRNTGLPNRVSLHDYLEDYIRKAAAKGEKFALFAVDLDDLQTVNDVFGRNAGDAAINETAKRLKDILGDKVFLAHVGADEFCAVMPGVSEELDYTAQAERFLSVVRNVYKVSEDSFHITASIGVVLYPSQGHTVDELMAYVDNAVAAAKKAGKDRWCLFAEEILTNFQKRMVLTNHLHQAIDNEEFVLYYQPQVEAATGRLTGFEALIRWISPELGFVPPDKFIALAEQTGLIQPIGKWVMRTACLFAKRLEQAGYGKLRVAVNVSGRQFARNDFILSLHRILATTEANPYQMEVEVTETAVLNSFSDTIRKLELLRACGLQVSLDDFGTGYSSLHYILQLPFDTLKIDKSFIDMIGEDAKGEQIVKVILALVDIMDKHVVAEGVETADQLEYLKQNGCATIQGYYFSKPLPEEKAFVYAQEHA